MQADRPWFLTRQDTKRCGVFTHACAAFILTSTLMPCCSCAVWQLMTCTHCIHGHHFPSRLQETLTCPSCMYMCRHPFAVCLAGPPSL
jgi:hypothetical protein